MGADRGKGQGCRQGQGGTESSVTPGRQVGMKANFQRASGNFNTLNAIIVLSVYGVSSGQADFFSNGGQLVASAEFGRLSDGTHYVVGVSRRGYSQFQFGVKNDQDGIADIDDVDFLRDNDDPNYGDGSLFP